MPRGTEGNPLIVLALAFALLLTLVMLPPILGLESPVGSAAAVETQRNPTSCVAVGNNWTYCDRASSSDDAYAEANEGYGGEGNITPITAFQDTEQSTTLTLLQDANAETTALPAGSDYLVIYSGNHGAGDTSTLSELVLEFGSTVIARGIGEGLGSGAHWASGQTSGFHVVTGDGTSTLRFRFRCVSGLLATCYAGAMAIVAIPLDLLTEGKDYWQVVRNGDGFNVTDADVASWTVLLTTTFNLPEAGNYITLMSAEGRTDGGNSDDAATVRFLANGTVLGSDYHQEWEDDADSMSFMKAQVAKLDAGDRPFTIEVRSRSDPTADFRRGRIVVLRASVFDQVVQSTDTSGASTTNTGFVDFSGLDTTYTPNLQEYVVVLANAVMGSSSEVAVAELRDDTAGVSYRIDSGEAENNNGFSPDRDQQPTLVVHAEQISSSTTWKLRFREALSGTAVIGRNPDNTTGIRSDLIVWGLSLPGPGKNDTAWSNFGYGLDPTDIVNRVEAGVEWFRTSQRPILNLSVSWDGGSTWAPNLTATNKSSDDDSVEWLDFSAATAWDASKLSDANFMVRVATNFSGARLDHVAVRINWVGSPNLDFLVTASTSTIQPGQTSVLRVEFTNSGQGPAEDIWVNVSFPAELSYVGDDAESIGGVLTGAYSYEFSSVTPGDYSFNITASAMGGTPNGTLVVTNFTFEATDHRGVPFIQTGQDVTITIVSGVIDLSLVSSMDDVDPGDTLTHNLMVRNVGSGIVQRLLIETFIDPNVTYISSSPMGNYSPVQRALNWTVAALDAGDTTSFEWSMVVNVGTPDLTVLVSPARVHYEDSNGTRLEAGPVAVPSTVRVASFSPQLDSDASTAERGDEVDITLYYNNTGTGTALRAWANWSLGGDYRLVSLTPTASYEVTAGGFSVVLDSVTPGDHSLVARLEVTHGMVDGLDLGLTVSWKATDGNGNPISEESLPTAMELLAPEVTLTLVSSKASVESGSILRLNVTIYNSGGAPATGWLNLTLPPGVEFVDTNASFDMSSTDGLLSWAVPNLPERSSTHIGVQLKLSGDPRTVSLRFAMDFTEGKGSPAESSMSDPVLVEVVSTGIDITSWPWWLWTLIVTMSVGTFAVAMRFRGGKVHVEEVFVIDPAGTLLAHRSSTILQHKDEDLVAAMFTAIQSYVKDVFSGGMDEEMRLLEFGERKILMEGGRHHHVAVIYRGRDSGGLAKRLHEVSQRIDEKFGDILADWDGAMDKVHGISMLLPRVWKGAR